MPARRYIVSPQGGGVPTAQTAAVVQITAKDPGASPTFGNRDDCFLTASSSLNSGTSPTWNPNVGQCAKIFGTAPGNDIVVAAGCANDFGTGPDPAGNKVITCRDSVNGLYFSIGEQLNNINDCNFDARFWWFPSSQPLLSTSWTGTGAVSAGGVLTIGSGSGPFRLNQQISSAHTPAVTPAGGETLVISLLSGSLGAPGSTYQLGGGIGATTFASEAMTTTDVVLIQRLQTVSSNFTDYPGAVCVELFGTDHTNTYFGGANPALAVGAGSVSTGPIVGPAGPGLALGFGFNGGINEGAGGVFCPGANLTNSQALLNYDQGQPLLRFQWQHFSSLGTRSLTWDSSVASNFLAMGAMFRDHP